MGSARRYDRAAAEMRRPAPARVGGQPDVRELVRLATLAASSHNTQPWKFRMEADGISIMPDFARRCPAVDPDDAHLFKSLGCAAENLVHAAAAQGFVAEPRFLSHEGRIAVPLRRSPVARGSVLARALTRRQCVRGPYDGRPLTPAQIEAMAQAAQGEGVWAVMLTSRADKETVLDYVAQGNHAQLRDSQFRRELLDWIRFNPRDALRTRDGLAGRTSGRPALPAWLGRAVAPLAITAHGQTQADAQGIRSAAGIAVFVAQADDAAAWVEAGRAYERFALRATTLEVRNAFVNQPIEVRALRPQFESWLKLEGAHALLIVRFGRGPGAPFSLRRPVEEVLVG